LAVFVCLYAEGLKGAKKVTMEPQKGAQRGSKEGTKRLQKELKENVNWVQEGHKTSSNCTSLGNDGLFVWRANEVQMKLKNDEKGHQKELKGRINGVRKRHKRGSKCMLLGMVNSLYGMAPQRSPKRYKRASKGAQGGLQRVSKGAQRL
jgi:hypothetical protein